MPPAVYVYKDVTKFHGTSEKGNPKVPQIP